MRKTCYWKEDRARFFFVNEETGYFEQVDDKNYEIRLERVKPNIISNLFRDTRLYDPISIEPIESMDSDVAGPIHERFSKAYGTKLDE